MKNFFNNKNIAVIGASGYIGSKLVLELSKFECQINRITRNIKSLIPYYDSKAVIIDHEVDYNNVNWNIILNNIDIVYYLSSQTSTYVAEQDLIKDYNSSVKPIVEMLKQCENIENDITVIFASAVTICGLVESLPVNENYIDNPVTIYDTHKLLIENYLKFYSNKKSIKSASLRLSNVYGPGVQSSSNDRGILNKMALHAMHGKDLSVYGSGSYIRDYIHIDDVVNAFLKAAEHIDKINGNHYIISSGEGNTLKEAFELITQKVYDIMQIETKVYSVDAPETLSLIEYRNFIGNNNKFADSTGWRCNIKFQEGIESTIRYFNGAK